MPSTICTPSNLGDVGEISIETFAAIRELLKERTGFNLGSYKDKCMKRRIAIRVRALRCTSPEEYWEVLRCDPAETERLVKSLTIHVTHFFRNPSTYATLSSQVIPTLFQRAARDNRKQLTFWSVGCASGEEPYSLALLLLDGFLPELDRHHVSIIGTDVDPGVLDQARQGLYGPERIADLPVPLREAHFSSRGRDVQLSAEVRQMVSFHQGDLLDSEPGTACDLILCRNVLIYFERKSQADIIHRLADALHPEGVLVLGKSETLFGETRRRFSAICPIERIYRKT